MMLEKFFQHFFMSRSLINTIDMRSRYALNDSKAAKKLIKRAKKNPTLYTEQEVLYAKLIKRVTKHNEKDKETT